MFNYVKFVTTKKGMTTNFFSPSLLLLFLDPGSGINIPDPQHCSELGQLRASNALLLNPPYRIFPNILYVLLRQFLSVL
jgi:hypothetical protein